MCSNHGNCVQGLCNCSVGYKGLSCELTVLCSYFDTNASEWSTRGCSVVASPPGYTYCECYHLTDFGGIGIPTSAEDLLAEIEGIRFRTFTADDIVNVLGNFVPGDNVEIFTLLMACTVIDVFMILYSLFRRHRRTIRKSREAAMLRKQAKQAARKERKLQAMQRMQSTRGLRRAKRVSEEAWKAGLANSRFGRSGAATPDADVKDVDFDDLDDYDGPKKKKNPAIQDRVFLDLIEADLYGVIAPPSPQMFLRQKQYEVATDDEFHESVSAPAAAPAAAPETPDRLDTLLELLGGAGDALPSVESPDVPWAELLQQRMAGAKQRIAGPVQSVRIAQQRGQPIGAQGPGVLQQRLQRIKPIGAQSAPAGSPGTLLAGTLAASASLGNFRQQRLRRYGTSVEAGGRLAALSPRGSRLCTPAAAPSTEAPLASDGDGSLLRRTSSSAGLVLAHRGAPREQMPGAFGVETNLTPSAVAPRTPSRPDSAALSGMAARGGAGLASLHILTQSPPPSPPAASAYAVKTGKTRTQLDDIPSEEALWQMLQQVDQALGSEPSSPVETEEMRSSRMRMIHAPKSRQESPRDSSVPDATDVDMVRMDEASPEKPQQTRMTMVRPPKRLGAAPDDAARSVEPALRAADAPGAADDAGEVRGSESIAPDASSSFTDLTQLGLDHLVDENASAQEVGGPATGEDGVRTRPSVEGERTRTSVELSPSKPAPAAPSSGAVSLKERAAKAKLTAADALSAFQAPKLGDMHDLTTEERQKKIDEKMRTLLKKSREEGKIYVVKLKKKVGERLGIALSLGTQGVLVRAIAPESLLVPHNVEVGDEILSINGDEIKPTGEYRVDGVRVDPEKMFATLAQISGSLELRIRSKRPKAAERAARSLRSAAATSGNAMSNAKSKVDQKWAKAKDQAKDQRKAMTESVYSISNRMIDKEKLAEAKKKAAELKRTLTTKQGLLDLFLGGGARTKLFLATFWKNAQSEHTIINAIAPPEEDFLGNNLQDEQVIHIFWSTMLGELAVIFLLSDSSSESAFPILQIMILGFMTAVIVGTLAKIMKDIFKFCNKKRRYPTMYDRLRRRWASGKDGREAKLRVPLKVRVRECIAGTPGFLYYCIVNLPGFLAWCVNPYNWVKYRKQMARRAAYQRKQNWLTRNLDRTFRPGALKQMEQEARDREKAAVRMQGLARRREARKELYKRRKGAGTEDAAIAVQNAARRRASKKVVLLKRQEKVENDEAATKLQAAARRRSSRKTVDAAKAEQEAQREEKKQQEASMKMQAAQRRRTAQNEVKAKRMLARDEAEAAVKLQAMQRRKSAQSAVEKRRTESRPGTRTGHSPPPSPPEPKGSGGPKGAQARWLAKSATAAEESTPAAISQMPRLDVSFEFEADFDTFDDAEVLSKLAGLVKVPKANITTKVRRGDGEAQSVCFDAEIRCPDPTTLEDATQTLQSGIDRVGSALGMTILQKPRITAADPSVAVAMGRPVSATRKMAFVDLPSSLSTPAGDNKASQNTRAEMNQGLKGKKLLQKVKGIKMAERLKVASEEEKRRKISDLIPFTRRYIMFRWTMGWFINLSIFVTLWIICLVYGVTFGPLAFQQVVIAWFFALGQTWLVVEPTEVGVLTLLPSIASNKYVVRFKLFLKDAGFV